MTLRSNNAKEYEKLKNKLSLYLSKLKNNKIENLRARETKGMLMSLNKRLEILLNNSYEIESCREKCMKELENIRKISGNDKSAQDKANSLNSSLNQYNLELNNLKTEIFVVRRKLEYWKQKHDELKIN
jgi:chromosome segregation ATPase